MVTGSAVAAFSATASNSGNTFGAGSLSLTVTPFGGTTSTSAFTVPSIVPGQSVSQLLTLTNTGSTDSISTLLTSITPTTTTFFNLGDKLTLNIYDDVNGDDTILGGVVSNTGDDVLRGSDHITSAGWTNISLGFGLNGGASHKVVAKVTFDADSTNDYQLANSTFDLNFQTNQ